MALQIHHQNAAEGNCSTAWYSTWSCCLCCSSVLKDSRKYFQVPAVALQHQPQ